MLTLRKLVLGPSARFSPPVTPWPVSSALAPPPLLSLASSTPSTPITSSLPPDVLSSPTDAHLRSLQSLLAWEGPGALLWSSL